jgi:release factor glutamine methyltransferase
MTRVGDLLKSAESRLTAAGLEAPQLESEFLIASLLGLSRAEMLFRRNHPVNEPLGRRVHAAVERRGRREPLAYVLQEQPFLDLLLYVTPDVLIPRPETELLAERAVQWLARWDGATAVDVGTGSGAVALALKHRSGSRVLGIDISPAALAVARANADRLCLEVDWLQGDLLSPLPEDVEPRLIVANLPYVRSDEVAGLQPEVQREPRLALDGGPDGLQIIRRLIDEAQERLGAGGVLLLEAGFDQAAPLAAEMERLGAWSHIEVFQDLAGLPRIVQAIRKGR